MRVPLIAGNWKMNLSRGEATTLAAEVDRAAPGAGVEVVVCPPSCYLDAVREQLTGGRVGLGAQNMYHEPSGAFTGEVAPTMLVDLNCQFVILGHSERRHVFGETDALIAQKVRSALQHQLTPIVCVGELLEERESGRTDDVVRGQFLGAFDGLSPDDMGRVVIAYEPVWAIGTGKVATPEQAEEVHANIRAMLRDQFAGSVAEQVRIQYGGSVKPDNAAELLGQPNIDGALVGGAALKADSFLAIVQAA